MGPLLGLAQLLGMSRKALTYSAVLFVVLFLFFLQLFQGVRS